jgi:LmbE family N-acetylglucosaminyl deacetylase
MRVLCVATHPDDEIIGVGGVLARHASEGDEVVVSILSRAGPARFEKVTPEIEARVEKRKECTRRACAQLGVDTVDFHDFPDNSFDDVPLLDIVKVVEQEIRSYEPELIYTHHYGDLNISHELTCRAVITAARPLPDSEIRRILAYETLSNSEWSVPNATNRFQPSVFVDISDYLDTKLDALVEHETELRTHPHPRTIDNVRRNARLWGAKAGVPAAEAFELLREVRRDEP